MENSNEIWQADLGGQISETTFDVITQWIADGTLLPQDKIRRGNLRWIEAGKVPSLHGFFNAKDLGIGPPSVNTHPMQQTFGGGLQTPILQAAAPIGNAGTETGNNFCVLHSTSKAAFLCDVCANYFCESCPQRSGVNLVSCPMCGANCQNLEPQRQAIPPLPTNPPAQPSFNPKPPVERSVPLSAPDGAMPYTSINDPAKPSGSGIFAIVVVCLLLSGSFAYILAYQVLGFDGEAEKKLPKMVALEEKLNAEKAEEERQWKEAQAEVRRKKEAEIALRKANQTSSISGTGCFKSSTMEMIPCSDSMQKFREEMAEKNKAMMDSFQQMQDGQKAAMDQWTDQMTANFRPPSTAQEEFDREKKKVIEEYRQQTTRQRFGFSFIISFATLFGLIMLKRKFSK